MSLRTTMTTSEKAIQKSMTRPRLSVQHANFLWALFQELVREVRRSHRDQALDAPADPHHAHHAEAGLPAHAQKGQLQTVERMRWVGDADGLRRERGYFNGGIVLRGF
jgi:hypothetical protein